MADSTVSLKLLIDTIGKRVLYAEAGKDFMDFLILTLSLPVSKLSNLLQEQGIRSSFVNLYKSVEKDNLLKSVAAVPCGCCSVPLLAGNVYVSDEPGLVCPYCFSAKLTKEAKYVPPPPVKQASSSGEGGFVNGPTTYMVTDDLVVMPLSTIASIDLPNRFNVEKVDALEVKKVDIGMNEAMKLLRASIFSKNVLTDVFLGENTEMVKHEQN